MHRRHVLVLLLGAAAGCSSQSADPTATPEPTPATDRPTETTAPTSTATPTETRASIDTVVTSLNEVYATLEPALETLDVSGLDTDALAERLQQVQQDIESAREAGTEDEARLQSLSDTRWIFDRIVRAFVRFDAAYALHSQLQSSYEASEVTSETTAALNRFRTTATEAASSAGTAVSRYDSLDEFDPALDVQYEAFESQIFRVSDTANALTPLVRGIDAAISARERYLRAVASYENESYADAQSAFADLLNEFSDALERFENADGLSGPLAPALEQYRCEARAARLACVEYRAACREQRGGDSDAAERRRNQAEERYVECRPTQATENPQS